MNEIVDRDKYWDDALRIQLEIKGIHLSEKQRQDIEDAIVKISITVQEAVEKIMKAILVLVEELKPVMDEARYALNKLAEELRFIKEELDFDSPKERCYPLKPFTKENQYFHNCFKLSKLNYNIRIRKVL